MIAAPPANFEALEAQARTLLAVFIAAGYEAVAPDVIQPAGVFLDVVGEALRGRTYVFTDLDGKELCLRPDLTVPTCRLYLQRHPGADREAFYSYNGPAFRFQPASADAAHPREFRQAGIEAFGDKDAGEADARTLVLMLRGAAAGGSAAAGNCVSATWRCSMRCCGRPTCPNVGAAACATSSGAPRRFVPN